MTVPIKEHTMPGPAFTYRHTGTSPKVFPSLAGVLVYDQGRNDAVLNPGDEICLPFAFYDVDLDPADNETREGTPTPTEPDPVKKARKPRATKDIVASDVAVPVVPVDLEPVDPS